MRGYELIVLANGILFLTLGFLSLANGLLIERKGDPCATGNVTQCQRDLTIGATVRNVAPYVASVGILLLGIGMALIAHRRWYGPPEKFQDEGPRYE